MEKIESKHEKVSIYNCNPILTASMFAGSKVGGGDDQTEQYILLTKENAVMYD